MLRYAYTWFDNTGYVSLKMDHGCASINLVSRQRPKQPRLLANETIALLSIRIILRKWRGHIKFSSRYKLNIPSCFLHELRGLTPDLSQTCRKNLYTHSHMSVALVSSVQVILEWVPSFLCPFVCVRECQHSINFRFRLTCMFEINIKKYNNIKQIPLIQLLKIKAEWAHSSSKDVSIASGLHSLKCSLCACMSGHTNQLSQPYLSSHFCGVESRLRGPFCVP